MKIEAIKGMIMDVAPSNSEAIGIWMCSGFNTRNAIWRFELKQKGIELELTHPKNQKQPSEVLNSAYKAGLHSYEPWKLSYDTLWKITSNNQGKLKYIYIFSNPEDKRRLNTLEDIDSLIKQCLDVLKENSINSISFLLIPALPRGVYNTDLEDLESAKQMIYSIKNWLSINQSNMQVYLVDRVDGFKAILEQIDSK